MLKAGGKHFRAQLLLSVVQSNKPELLNQALDVALALNLSILIHSYTMIYPLWIMRILDEEFQPYTKATMKLQPS